jgi:hypothetical protein
MPRLTLPKMAMLVAAAVCGFGCPRLFGQSGDTNLGTPRLTRTIPLPGVGISKSTTDGAAIPGRLDHLAYDPATDRLFIAALDQSSLEVVDLKKGERIKRITGLEKPQGIAVVPAAGCLAVACGDEDAVHVYGLKDLKPRAVTKIGQDVDNVRCDGGTQVYIGFGSNQGAGGLAVYDAVKLRKVEDIWLGSHPESFQLDLRPGATDMFVNLPARKSETNDGTVLRLDRNHDRILATWRLPGAAQNFPMALDADRGHLFIATRRPPELICLDAKSGDLLSRAECVADSDDIFYDAATQKVLVIGGGRAGEDAALEIYNVATNGQVSRVASVPTSPHARTGYFVPERRAVYVACPPHGGEDAKVLEFNLGR